MNEGGTIRMRARLIRIRGATRAAAVRALTLVAVTTLALSTALVAAVGAGSDPTRPIGLNQTDGFGNNKVLVFTYGQQFACLHEPFADLNGPNHNGDGKLAAEDPAEFQTPQCIVGPTAHGSPPTIDPTGGAIRSTQPLFVIVPFFNVNGVFQATAASPAVDVQCPEPGPEKPGVTVHTTSAASRFGTCTMHATTLHAEPAGLGHLPLVNHSHIIDGDSFGSIWWQIIVVLVTDRGVWADINGGCPAGGEACLTSVKALRNAQAAGIASGDVPTNFFLFFDAKQLRTAQ